MKTGYWPFSFSIILFTTVLSVSVCLAESQRNFHSENNGYSITIPDGWIEIPNEIVTERFALLASAEAKATYSFEMAFQQSASGQWFEYPYVLVQVIKYSNLGLNRQIHKSEFKQIISGLTGLDIDDVINKSFSADAKGLFSGGAIGKVSLDEENKLYVFGMEMNVEDTGKKQAQAAGHFGQYSIIQVMYYDWKSNWNQSIAERELIQGSFKFDPAMAYNETAKKPSGFLEGIVLRYSSRIFNVLIIVGVAVWWWRYDWRKRSLKKYDKVHKNEAND